MKLWKDEAVLGYINSYHNFSLKCKDPLSEASTVEMHTQGMAWDLLYVLQMSKPRTFQEFATKAHDIEATITNSRDNSFNVAELKKDREEFRKNVMFFIHSTQETMTISRAGPV